MPELIHGRHAVLHALKARRRRVRRLHLSKSIEQEEPALIKEAQAQKIPVQWEAPGFFRSRFENANPQGVAAEVDAYPYVSFNELLQEEVILLLDEVQDPQNLGALCRTAHVLGVGGVVIPETHAASVSAGSCQASVGAVEYLKIARVSSIAQALETLKKNEFWIYGADINAEKHLPEEKFPKKTAIVVGSEEKGLRRLVRERCDILLKIPQGRSEIDSLNASVAGAVFIYEVFRQRGKF